MAVALLLTLPLSNARHFQFLFVVVVVVVASVVVAAGLCRLLVSPSNLRALPPLCYLRWSAVAAAAVLVVLVVLVAVLQRFSSLCSDEDNDELRDLLTR